MGFDKWKLERSEIVFHERYIRVKKDHLTAPQDMPTPRRTDYVYLEDEIPGTVLILAQTAESEIALVRQYRYPVQQHLLSLPGGIIDPGEDPLTAAKRELREETGLTAEQWIDAGAFYPMPSHHTRKARLFIARHLTDRGRQELDPFEDIEVVYMSPSDLLNKIKAGECMEMELCFSVLMAKEKGLLLEKKGEG